MSNIGRGAAGQIAPEVLQVVREVVRELEGFGRATRGATQAQETTARQTRDTFRVASADFYKNAAFSAADHLTRDFAASALGNLTKGMGAAQSLQMGALSAASNLPFVGDLFGQVKQPLDAASGRVLGVTGMIARAGGTVTPEMREALKGVFLPQELRAAREAAEVSKLINEDDMAQAMQGTRLLEAFNVFADNLERASRALERFFGAGPAQR